ncbi:winged helix-turn-helix domain-containing protein [Streptomyces sp. NPDC059070]|uniref:winged helix-turn-helix domain-containing protein n=1 Tax=unclassified Streptomyces TaxID=2593676 RepID=UPI0034E29DD3
MTLPLILSQPTAHAPRTPRPGAVPAGPTTPGRPGAGRPGPTVPGRAAPGTVRVLRWPEQAAQLEQCRADGVPRLLLVAPATPPPRCVDQLEDWIRTPADPQDLHARQAALQVRAAPRDPVLDHHGILHFGDQSLPLAPGEAALVRLLLAAYRGIVSREDLTAQMWPAAENLRRNALDVRILRVRRRLAPLGLVIKTVWGNGYMLDAEHRTPAARRPVRAGE